MMQTATCYSQLTDSFAAGKHSVESLLAQLNNQKPHFLFLFTSVGHDIPEVLRGIQSILPHVPLIGCSGAGTITNEGCDEMTHSLSLMAIRCSRIHFHPFICENLSEQPELAGNQIADMVNPLMADEEGNKLLILLTEGLKINADAMQRGMENNLSRHLDIVGGTAGNDFQGENTYQIYNDKVITNGASGVVLTGDFPLVEEGGAS